MKKAKRATGLTLPGPIKRCEKKTSLKYSLFLIRSVVRIFIGVGVHRVTSQRLIPATVSFPLSNWGPPTAPELLDNRNMVNMPSDGVLFSGFVVFTGVIRAWRCIILRAPLNTQRYLYPGVFFAIIFWVLPLLGISLRIAQSVRTTYSCVIIFVGFFYRHEEPLSFVMPDSLVGISLVGILLFANPSGEFKLIIKVFTN